jgi:hypothetical protein
MKTCDKCGSSIREKYPWYSYYAPGGEATTMLFRYCSESKTMLQRLYGIDDEYFAKAVTDEEESQNNIEYINYRR